MTKQKRFPARIITDANGIGYCRECGLRWPEHTVGCARSITVESSDEISTPHCVFCGKPYGPHPTNPDAWLHECTKRGMYRVASARVEPVVPKCNHLPLQAPWGGICNPQADEKGRPMTYWGGAIPHLTRSKDPLVPYQGCECSTCAEVRDLGMVEAK